MKYKRFFLTASVIFFFQAVFGQTHYALIVHRASAAYDSSKFIKSALLYREAFVNYPDSVNALDVFHSARSWAAAGNADSAIVQLKSASIGYKFNKYGMLMADPGLSVLHQRQEWEQIASKVNQNREASYSPFQLELKGIRDDDQKYRLKADSISKAGGTNSADFIKVSKEMASVDSINLEKVKRILDTKGWPPYGEIGELYSSLFLVLQHADLKTQLKYLPMIQQAGQKNDVDPESAALLEDRIAVRQGKKQLYGSQVDYDTNNHIYRVFPIEDERNVNERRAQKGMVPLQDYLKQWGINYLPVK
jgi:hypothetical protein